MDFSEKWGKDVDEAIRLALIDLRCSEDEVDVIVIEEPTKGFLGLGAKLAKVRVEKKKNPDPAKKQDEKKQGATPLKVERNREIQDGPFVNVESVLEKEPEIKEEVFPKKEEEFTKKTEKISDDDVFKMESKFSIKEKPDDLVEVLEDPSLDFLKEIVEKMGLDLTIRAFKNDSHIYVEMEGKDSGTIIGKRGQTLDSIQYLTSLVVNKNKDKYIRVVVDAENYRSKREQTLEQLANRLADKVVKTGRSVRLEPMNPYERKVIHATLQQNPKVTTKSEGEEPFRRVVVDLK